MLASGADAFLGIDGAREGGEFGAGRGAAQEDGFELVHARVGEEEGRVVERRGGAGFDEFVVVLVLEERHERRSDFRGGPVG